MPYNHTKGNWWYSRIGDELLSMPSQVKICKRISGSNESEAKANMSLIEKSPELLEAVYNMTSICIGTELVNQPAYISAIKLLSTIEENGK